MIAKITKLVFLTTSEREVKKKRRWTKTLVVYITQLPLMKSSKCSNKADKIIYKKRIYIIHVSFFPFCSPTGVSLKTHTQIKQYLLTPGTCKCGLPCPLRPEYFFEFNSQVSLHFLTIFCCY